MPMYWFEYEAEAVMGDETEYYQAGEDDEEAEEDTLGTPAGNSSDSGDEPNTASGRGEREDRYVREQDEFVANLEWHSDTSSEYAERCRVEVFEREEAERAEEEGWVGDESFEGGQERQNGFILWLVGLWDDARKVTSTDDGSDMPVMDLEGSISDAEEPTTPSTPPDTHNIGTNDNDGGANILAAALPNMTLTTPKRRNDSSQVEIGSAIKRAKFKHVPE